MHFFFEILFHSKIQLRSNHKDLYIFDLSNTIIYIMKLTDSFECDKRWKYQPSAEFWWFFGILWNSQIEFSYQDLDQWKHSIHSLVVDCCNPLSPQWNEVYENENVNRFSWSFDSEIQRVNKSVFTMNKRFISHTNQSGTWRSLSLPEDWALSLFDLLESDFQRQILLVAIKDKAFPRSQFRYR